MRIALFSIVCAAAVPIVLFAQIRQSTNYQIISDSLNAGGGFATSGSYLIEDTLGEQASGNATSGSYMVFGGYQQADESIGGGSISISIAPDVSMSALSGMTGGTVNATTTWTIITDANSGYTATIAATSTPALRATSGSAVFSDFVPAGGVPDFLFTVPSASSTFGFSPEGTDIHTSFKDNGSVCADGSSDTLNRCYRGLSTTPQTIATRGTANAPGGTELTVRFAAGVGSARFQDSGTYQATIVVTAMTQ